MTHIAKNRLKSTWTPLSNEETNNKIFEERLDLIGKWFKHWNDDQRKKVIESVMNKSKVGQLEHARDILAKRMPIYKDDFTRLLPRVLTLYIMSYLDPRSLCRCSQVSWHWRHLAESDQLWMPKCVRYGWVLPFMPGQFEVGVWKRNYIENIQVIQSFQARISPHADVSPVKKSQYSSDKDADQEKRKLVPRRPGSTPWRGSDKKPTDTFRFNYLDNDDEVERVRKLRVKGLSGRESVTIAEKAQNKVKTGSHVKNISIRTRSKSLTKLSSPECEERPQWASKPATESAELRSSVNANVRPEPVNKFSVRRPGVRSTRDPPSTSLFPNQPWAVPKPDDDSD